MIPVIDMHCDTISVIKKNQDQANAHCLECGSTLAADTNNQDCGSISNSCCNAEISKNALRRNSLHIDLERMKAAGYMCQNMAMFTQMMFWADGSDSPYRKLTPLEYVLQLSDTFDREVQANADLARQVLTGADIEENFKAGRVSLLKTVEEGAVYGGDINSLKLLYDKGVRMTTLTWNFENELAYPNYWCVKTADGKIYREKDGSNISEILGNLKSSKQKRQGVNVDNNNQGDGQPGQENSNASAPELPSVQDVWFEPDTARGLKNKGIEFVKACEELGIIIDVSHLNDAGIWDILKITKPGTPIVASHSNARALTPVARNLTDEMLKAIADKGGVAGINFCNAFINQRCDNFTTMDDMISHMQHMKKIAGADAIGLGSDFDGIDNVTEFGTCEGIQRLADKMEIAGFSADEIEKIFYKNVLRVYKVVL